MYKYLLYFILFFTTSIPSFAWKDHIVNYSRDEYSAGFQNWMITQHKDGWIYIANNEGLLEYDGVFWRLYEIPNYITRSVYIDTDTIYVGGSCEIGYFTPDMRGFLTYHSLNSLTKEWAGEVWNIVKSGEYIYFISDGYIHKYHPIKKEINSNRMPFKVDNSILHHDTIYLASTLGLFTLDKENLTPHYLAITEPLKNQKIGTLVSAKNHLLIGTRYSGFYKLNNNNLSSFDRINHYLKDKYPLYSAAISGNTLVVGTVNSGVCIFDMDSISEYQNYGSFSGLANNTVLSINFDNNNNLWLGMDKGISFVELKSPIKPMFSTISPIGTGYASIEYQGELYLGTNQGLYRYNRGNPIAIKGSEGQIWSLRIYDNKLFAAGDNGITIIDEIAHRTQMIKFPSTWEVSEMKASINHLLVATYSGFAILEKKNGLWYLSHEVDGCTDSTSGFIEDETPNWFWYINSKRKIECMKLSNDFKQIVDRKVYDDTDIEVNRHKSLQYIDNRLVVCSNKGILEYSRVTDSFHPNTQLESILDGNKDYRFLYLDSLKNIWYIADKELKLARYINGKYNKINLGMANQLIANFQNIRLINSRYAIIAVDNGFTRVDFEALFQQSKEQKPFVLDITTGDNNDIIYYRNGKSQKEIVIPYKQNTISIHYGALLPPDDVNTYYSYRLKEKESKWSKPTTLVKKEYTNLYEGKYSFQVMIVDAQEKPLSAIAEVNFVILSPWYRTTLAYICYIVVFVVFFYLIYLRITYMKRLELIEQRKRHQAITKLKDQEIIELQNENLKTKLQYKSQELSGQLLQVQSKNEALEKVKAEAIKISKAIDERQNSLKLKQYIIKLISTINKSIDSDDNFEAFRSNFDLVHKDFFKTLEERHPDLSRNDKILCAYIQMNMLSKEIAPLMNITIRSVEANRYRLRKRLGLDRDDNLSDYLQNLSK